MLNQLEIAPHRDEIIHSVRTPWIPAAALAPISSEQDDLSVAPAYAFNRGSTAATWNELAFSKIALDLAKSDADIRSHVLPNSLVLGCGFLILSGRHPVQETRYLADSVEKRIAHSFRDPEVLGLQDYYIVVGHAPVKNYYHWTAQVLPALLQSRDLLDSIGVREFGLVAPKLNPWQRESLELLGFGTREIIELTVFQRLRCKYAVYSSLLGAHSPFVACEYRRQLATRIRNTAKAQSTRKSRILVSRRDAGLRRIGNEQELLKAIQPLGFNIIVPGELSVCEQVRAFADADTIIAPHGAGSANYIYCSAETKILELIQSSHPNAGPAALAKSVGLNFWVDVFDDNGLGTSAETWTVEVASVLSTLEMMGVNT